MRKRALQRENEQLRSEFARSNEEWKVVVREWREANAEVASLIGEIGSMLDELRPYGKSLSSETDARFDHILSRVVGLLDRASLMLTNNSRPPGEDPLPG